MHSSDCEQDRASARNDRMSLRALMNGVPGHVQNEYPARSDLQSSNGSVDKSSAAHEPEEPSLLDLAPSEPNSVEYSQTFPNPITLNIGGRMFVTTPSTLRSKSGFFCRQLSESFLWWPSPDGSYFFDADPELFAHLLRFMRRPSAFPLFYDQAKGFDYDLYNRLELEAEFFQIKELRNWIAEKKYLTALVISKEDLVQDVDIPGPERHHLVGDMSINTIEEQHYVQRIKKVYLCPRGIFVHQGSPEKCGQACKQAQEEQGPTAYTDEHSTVVAVSRKQIIFNANQCRSG